MQCPECQFDNPDEAKFCNECGCSQKRSCPSCNNLNLPASKFCNECGTKLITTDEAMPKEMSFDEKLNKIQRYLPKGVTEKNSGTARTN